VRTSNTSMLPSWAPVIARFGCAAVTHTAAVRVWCSCTRTCVRVFASVRVCSVCLSAQRSRPQLLSGFGVLICACTRVCGSMCTSELCVCPSAACCCQCVVFLPVCARAHQCACALMRACF